MIVFTATSPWVTCSLEEEILAILETDSPVSLRHLCALLYPSMSWQSAQIHAADKVRQHCQSLMRQRLVSALEVDTFGIIFAGEA